LSPEAEDTPIERDRGDGRIYDVGDANARSALKPAAIDNQRMVIHVEAIKGRKDCTQAAGNALPRSVWRAQLSPIRAERVILTPQ
jgi:hypothetical protein